MKTIANSKKTKDTTSKRKGAWAFLMPVLLLAPLELGAKGCDSAVVGNDCPVGSIDVKCTGSSGMANTGGASSAGSGNKGGDANSGGNSSSGDVCGGLLGTGCDKDEFCDFPIQAQCGAADRTGICRSLPTACTTEYKPVCGCNGVTYGNACAAAAAGVSLASEGACADTPRACGPMLGRECPRGQFCDFRASSVCGKESSGTCRDLPQLCTEEYAPVCGCDNQTYSNACSANAQGVSVASKGDCGPTPTTCTAKDSSCGEGTFCEFPIGTGCGADGKPYDCAKKPEACDAIYDPVCGCDGQTYASQCAAAMAGVSVAKAGECQPAPEQSCGGLKGTTCAKGQFCDYPIDARCGAADQTGVCRTPPQGCTKIYEPVCGCDGLTYSNACLAAVAGVSVSSKGECASQGKACGARLGDTCADTEFCDFPEDASCGRADATGLCKPLPTACREDLSPVCGCDGQQYSNACMANAAGTSVDPENLCEGEPKEDICGGLLGATCPDDQYCAFSKEAQCGSGDQTGVCKVKPDGCTAQYEPVCGCDGKTYGNACEAASAGVSVWATGVCQ